MKKYKVIKKVTFENVLWDKIDNNTLLSYLCFLNNTGREFCNEIIPSGVFENGCFSDIAKYITNTPKLLNFLVDNRYIEEVIEFKPVTITIETLEEFKSLYCYAKCEHIPEVRNEIKRNNEKDFIPKTNSLNRIWAELLEIGEKII